MSDRFYDKRLGEGPVPAQAREVVRAPGAPLSAPLRAAMEQRFGVDFSRIRIHADDRAAQSARALDAQAYTVGRDLVFDRGRYAPDSRTGRSLLMHELAHAVQQGLPQPDAARGLTPAPPSAARQANDITGAAARGEPSGAPASAAPPQLARATRTFALTFDDGPHAAELGKGANRTEKVLDTLREKKIKAAFFIQTAALDPEGHETRGSAPAGKKLVERMYVEGHVVEIHTGGKKDHETHPVSLKAGRLEGELESAKTYVEKHTGEPAKWVRPPKGKGAGDAGDKDVQEVYTKAKLTQLLWDIDGDGGANLKLDALQRRVTTGIAAVQKREWKPNTPSPNIVVLYHDIQKGTADNLATLIEYIKTTTQEISDKKDVADFGLP